MTTPVEARSLSSLTTLFANPPQYPRNPTHKVLEPLVLYIGRVPGSKDVFLTPLKPPTKGSISAEAIQSSLYYFHITSPEDDEVAGSLKSQQPSSETVPVSGSETIHRKPLPSSLLRESVGNEQASSLPDVSSPFQPSASGAGSGTEARPDSGLVQRLSARQLVGTDSPTLKPVGPRAFQPRLTTTNSEVLPRKPIAGAPSGTEVQRAWTEAHLRSPISCLSNGETANDAAGGLRTKRYVNFARGLVPDGGPQQEVVAPELSPRPSDTTSRAGVEKGLRVTIIRRDLASGAQWNIGSLSRKVGPEADGQDSLRIEITAPGYQRFAGEVGPQLSTNAPFEQAGSPHHADSIKTGHREGTAGSALASGGTLATNRARFGPTPFFREILLNRSFSSHRSKTSDRRHQRSNSSDSFPVSLPKTTSPLSPAPQRQLTFLSPWQGPCTFTTGMDGRSLKCRHWLPTSKAEQKSDSSVLIAELRFNLPWSALKSRDTKALGTHMPDFSSEPRSKRPTSLAVLGGDAKHSFKKGMARIRRELNSSSLSESDVQTTTNVDFASPTTHIRPRSLTRHDANRSDSDSCSFTSSKSSLLDLKLGRERAGGGRDGKSAKLGKLVLRDGGLKMADLVVAASVGVWYAVYEGRGLGGRGGGG